MAIRVDHQNVHAKMRAGIISLTIGALLILVKMAAYIITDSAAILSDALESFVNVATAAFTLISIYVAQKPADEGHPYGHGKIEFISAGFEGAAILAAAFLIVYKVVNEFFQKIEIAHLGTGLILVAAAAAVNLFLGLYLIRTGKKTSSISIEADGRHVMTDVWTSAGVLVGIFVIRVTGYTILDPIIAIIVAVNITWMGAKLLRRSFSGMLDRADKKTNEIVCGILDSEDLKGRICGYHKLRSRKSGGFNYVDFHLLMPREMDIGAAHQIATQIEEKIAEALGEAGVMAHIEPCKDENCPTCEVRTCAKRAGNQVIL